MKTQFLQGHKVALSTLVTLFVAVSFFFAFTQLTYANTSTIGAYSSTKSPGVGAASGSPCSSVQGASISVAGEEDLVNMSYGSAKASNSGGGDKSNNPCIGKNLKDSLQKQLESTLKKIEELRARIAALNNGTDTATSTPKTPKPGKDERFCSIFTHTMKFGSRDSNSGGQVSALQAFLSEDSSIYPEGEVTGYFGEATRKAVQRFQNKNGIASGGGDENSTGFGMVGSKTRDAFFKRCDPKKDIFTVAHIKEILVTTNIRGNLGFGAANGGPLGGEAKVLVDMSTTTDISFTIGSTTRAKMIIAIGTKLDTEYRFRFATTSNRDARYTALNALTKWQQLVTVCSASFKCAKTYTLTDVSTVTFKHIRRGNDNHATSTRYTITLTDGTKRTVTNKDATTTSAVSEVFTKALRKTGYTGDIPALLAKAVAGSVLGVSTSSGVANVALTSPNSGESYALGSKLTVEWNATNIPKKSTVCTFLDPISEEGNFAFPGNDACRKIKDGPGKTTGILQQTPGYDLKPGSYDVLIKVFPQQKEGGKDVGPIAEDKSDSPIIVKAKGEMVQDQNDNKSLEKRIAQLTKLVANLAKKLSDTQSNLDSALAELDRQNSL